MRLLTAHADSAPARTSAERPSLRRPARPHPSGDGDAIALPDAQPWPPPETPNPCADCRLHGVMICADIPFEAFAEFRTHIDRLTIRRGDMLFQSKAPAARVYFVRAGFVKLVKYSDEGSQRIVRIVRAGGMVGMEAIFSASFEHTAVAMGEVEACSIPAASFRRMLDANPPLQRRLLEYSHRMLREAEVWLSELAGGNSHTEARLARLLLCLRDAQSDRIHRFSLEDLGAILGICLETVCRVLGRFKRAGLLSSTGYANGTTPFYYADISGLENAAGGLAVLPATPSADDSPPGRCRRQPQASLA